MNWQYQQLFEPLSQAKENVSADRWEPKLPVMPPRPKKGLTAAVLAGSLFFVPVVAAPAETVTCDKWQPSYPSQHSRRVQPQHASYFAPVTTPAPAETVTCDKWQPVYPSQHGREALPQQTAYFAPTTTPAPETITPDKWLGEQPDRVPGPRPTPQTAGAVFIEQIVFAAVVTGGAGGQEWEPNVYHARRLSYRPEGGTFFPILPDYTPLENVLLDRWKPTYPDSLWKRTNRAHLEPAVTRPITTTFTILPLTATARLYAESVRSELMADTEQQMLDVEAIGLELIVESIL